MKSKIKFQLSSKRQVAFTIILIAVMVAIGGYWYYSREKEQIIRQKEETLTAIATLKAKQIEIWYRDNLNDAQVISANPNLVEVAIRFIQSNWPIDRARLLVLLKQIQLEHELAEVFLTSSDGSIIAATNSQIAPIHPDELSSLKNAIHKGEAVSTGFFNAIQNGNKQSLISFISPLNTGVNNLSYAIIMRVDATNDILPLIESWPTESQTGESFIFSNETNSILLFNELKHQFEIETRDKLMVKKDDLLSNIYTSKQPGIYQGKDYRNVDVLASIKAIEGTNWVLIAKVDKSELLQDVMRLTLLTLVWVLLIVALSGLFIVAWYNKRQKNIYKGLLVNERELWAQQEKFNVIMDSLGDGIITLDLNGNIQYLNTRAEELTGWNLREARGRDFHEVYNVINEETRQQENNILDKVLKKGLVKELGNHTLLISKSGTEIPVMDTGAPLFDESGTVTGIAISFQDETEKRSQSRLLKQSEEKYRILVKNIPQKVFMKNQELSYIFCNENFADDLGITPDEIAGKTDYDFFSKEMADKYRNDDRFILENGETITLEEEYKAKDISFWVKTTKTPIKDEKGRTIGLLGIFEDITEKMRAQIALMKSEESLREFFEADLTGDYSATADSKILHCNPAFVGILGYGTAEEILGRNIAEMYQNPAERQEFLNLIQNQKVIKNYQSKLKRKDGTNIICNENIVGKFDANGKLVQYLGYMYDVTDKISAEEELRKKEQLLSSVMETQQELICRFLPDTTLTFVNKAYCKIFGRNEQELIGSKFLELIPENEWDGIMSVLKNINAENPSHTYVSSAYKPDGSVMSMEWTDTAILKKQNDVVEFQSVGRDITEKLKAEQELIEAKDKAEESDKLKSAFINNISHEIRTPLNGILGFGQLLAGSDIPPDKRMKYYDIVQESSNRLMNTLTDYLDMALIVSGTMEAQKKEFRLQPLFEEIIEKTKPVCADKMIELKTKTPSPPVDLILDSDPELISKIFNILFNNALKFTEKGSISCGYEIKKDFIKFFVQDTGKGIAHDKLYLIFNMFVQGDTSNSRGYEGSGIGLSIASGLVSLLGGTISVTSEMGKGSTFTFTVPFNETEVAEKSAPMEEKNGIVAVKPLILLAEDDESNYLYMEVVLKQAGCDYLLAKNGVEAVELCKQHTDITLVLMDIKMPVMDGLEATKLIREFRPELPIIATTAYAQTGDEHRFMAAGCNGYIAKPINKDKLFKLLQKLT